MKSSPSAVARQRGYRNNMPPFVQVGSQVDRRFGGGLAGYLGIALPSKALHGDNLKRLERDLGKQLDEHGKAVDKLREAYDIGKGKFDDDLHDHGRGPGRDGHDVCAGHPAVRGSRNQCRPALYPGR